MLRKLIQLMVFGLSALLATSASAELFEIGNQELQDLLEKNTTIIDVRRADEWQQTGVVDGSYLATFFDQYGRFSAEDWLTDLAEVTNPEAPIILICQTGVRSRIIGYWLSARVGFKQVYNVSDGIVSWKQAGKPVIAANQ
jgi:rhodanese-related sulfurtransferase